MGHLVMGMPVACPERSRRVSLPERDLGRNSVIPRKFLANSTLRPTSDELHSPFALDTPVKRT